MYKRNMDNRNIRDELDAFLAKYAGLKAVALLRVLLCQPNTPFDVIELSLRIRYGPTDPDAVRDFSAAAYPDIPKADAKALSQYRVRLNRLLGQKARRLAEDASADCSALDWEIGWLTRELRDLTKPGGGIKNSNPDKKKAYLSYRNAITRLLNKAREENPAVYDLVRRSLVTGKSFIWLDHQD